MPMPISRTLFLTLPDKNSVLMMRSIENSPLYVKGRAASCVSLMKMSPLTAVLKCPHYEKGCFKHESEGEAEVPSFMEKGGMFCRDKQDWMRRGPCIMSSSGAATYRGEAGLRLRCFADKWLEERP